MDSAFVGQRLRKLRLEKGWTQKEVAEKINMTKNGYGKLERGETLWVHDRLPALAEIYGVKPCSLLEEEDDSSVQKEKQLAVLIEKLETLCTQANSIFPDTTIEIERLKRDILLKEQIIEEMCKQFLTKDVLHI